MKKLLVLCSFCFTLPFADAQLVVSSAASFQTNSAISPGAIITIKGPNLAAAPVAAPDSTHPPTTLGNVMVTVNDVPCKLYYVSPGQINAVVDPSVASGPGLLIVLSPTGSSQVSVNIQSPAAPAIFTVTGTGSGTGAIVNAATANTEAFSVTTGTGQTFLALFVTSLDTKTQPIVWIGGISAQVSFFGDPGVYPGMQQINVAVPASLAGAGRVEVVVEQNGRRSNAVEVVMLPAQNAFADDQPNTIRSRELATVAWIPGTNLALVVDENDDVVRVIDLSQRRVTHVIALPNGAQPSAIGVHGAGALAIVAQRGRGSIALIDLNAYNVIGEFQTGLGASAIAVSGDLAIIANADSDTASFFTFRAGLGTPALQVIATVQTGRAPRAVAVDSQHAYVTNESAGTVTVIALGTHSVSNTINLGVNVRPGAIQVLEDQGLAIVAEPSAGPGGKVIFVKVGNQQFTSVSANPDQTGGASSIVAVNDQIYLANQTGGSVTTTPVTLLPDSQFVPADIKLNPANTKVAPGARSLAVDTRDNLLLIANESDGTVATIDLASNNVTARIDSVRVSSSETSDDHSDRLNAPNMPTLSSASPATTNAGGAPVSLTLTINGTNLAGASGVLFVDPATVSSLSQSRGNQNRGFFGVSDPAITVSGIQVDATGTKLTAQVQIAPNTQPRTRVLRVLTPNGETSLSGAASFAIQRGSQADACATYNNSDELKKNGISTAAVSGASEP